MIHLHTLGDARIVVGQREIRPTSPLMFAALLYLGVERGRRVPRAALQEMLFPNADERSGAHSLRQLLYKLRRLGAAVEGDERSVWVGPDKVSDDCAGALGLTNGNAHNAVKYGLGFAPGYEPELSDAYGDWADIQRATVAAFARRELISALHKSRKAVDWRNAERFARAIHLIDPLNEEATFALAEAAAASGSKSEALTLLARYEEETGRTELTLPSKVLRQRISENVPERTRATCEEPFVGRESEVASLTRDILSARAGKPSLSIVSGEPGIGKTRLVEEITALAALEGLSVHVVKCQPHYRARPLGVFIELVPSLLSRRGAIGVSPASLEYLKLLVSHADNRPDRPIDSRDDVTRSGAVLTALHDLIDAVASETPLLVIIEDAHWADADSLRELSSITCASQPRSLALVYTTRAMTVVRNANAVTESCAWYKLKPLRESAMFQLAQHLLSTSASDSEALSSCVHVAAGNPLFLHSICAHYGETGQLGPLPPDLISAIRQRVERLSTESQRVLQFASLLGRHSTVEALLALLHDGHLQLLESMQALEEEGLMHLRGDGVRVAHDVIGQCAVELVAPASQRIVHSYIASYLEQRYETTQDAAVLWDSTEHWTLSGESEKAIEFLRRCARHASDMGRASQALQLLQRALTFATWPELRARVLEELLAVAKAADQWQLMHTFAQQLSLVRGDGAPVHSDGELLGIQATWMSSFHVGENAPRLLACISASQASQSHRLDAATLLLHIAFERGDPALAQRTFKAVAPILDDSLTYANRMIPLIYHTSFGDRDRGIEIAHALCDDLDLIHPVSYRLRAGINTATALMFLGDDARGIQLFRDLHAQVCAWGMTQWQWDFASSLCWCLLEREKVSEAEQWYQRTQDYWSGVVAGPTQQRKQAALGCEIAIWRRDVTRARQLVEELERLGSAESVRVAAFLCAYQTRLKLVDPDYRSTEDELDELIRLYKGARSLLGADYFVVTLGEALNRAGRGREAAGILEEYVSLYRRERFCLTPSFTQLLDKLGSGSRS